MKEISSSNFGLLIAFLLPGFTILWGMSYCSPTVAGWLDGTSEGSPTVGGFLYVTIASAAAGMSASAVRWLVIDKIHHLTGIRQPQWDFSTLERNVTAFNVLVEIHYKHYQFYSNMLVALTFTYVAYQTSNERVFAHFGWPDVAYLVLACVFFVTSRDTLRKYHTRGSKLLGTEPVVLKPPSNPSAQVDALEERGKTDFIDAAEGR